MGCGERANIGWKGDSLDDLTVGIGAASNLGGGGASFWRLRHARRWNHSNSWNIIVNEIFAEACRGAALSSQRLEDVVGITILSIGEIVDAEDEEQGHNGEKV